MAGRIAVVLAMFIAAGPASVEDGPAACMAAVAEVRDQAAALPAGDPSRRFAEHDLDTALTEMNAGEVEECPGLVENARMTLLKRLYRLRPGERLRGYGPDSQD